MLNFYSLHHGEQRWKSQRNAAMFIATLKRGISHLQFTNYDSAQSFQLRPILRDYDGQVATRFDREHHPICELRITNNDFQPQRSQRTQRPLSLNLLLSSSGCSIGNVGFRKNQVAGFFLGSERDVNGCTKNVGDATQHAQRMAFVRR